MSVARTVKPGIFRDGVVELPERTLHYVECGSGRPVVLLHGYTDSWFSFRLVLPSLADGARCLALDQRGHGDSVCREDNFSLAALAADVAAFIDAQDLGTVALVGHSMGSLVARRVAVDRPDLVDQLVLVGPPLRTDLPTRPLQELKDMVERFGPTAPRAFVEEFQAACIHDRAAVPDWFFTACVDASAGVLPRVWRDALAAMLVDDSFARLGEIRCPTLVIGGREDAFFGLEEQAALARAIPRARLLVYDDVGHSPHWECPERFAADVMAFLGEGA